MEIDYGKFMQSRTTKDGKNGIWKKWNFEYFPFTYTPLDSRANSLHSWLAY